jgi:glycyl-tRNA synthetase beta chain
MPNYLLEIGTEELPAGHIPAAQAHLAELMADALKAAYISFERIESLSTPRRLAIIVRGLSDKQATTTKKVKGPPVKSSFEDNGNPKPAASGFADKQGLKVEQLDREEINGVAYLVANLTIEGKPTEEVLSEIAPRIIMQLSGERLMRWGSLDIKFSRPIRWLVSLLDHKIVPFSLEGLEAGRESHGHRILAKERIVQIKQPDTYASQLKEAHVLVDPGERKQMIEEQVAAMAKALPIGGRAKQLTGALLEEVVHITEWPHAVYGEFAREYLDLPDKLIETVMVHHQRYFPVQKLDAVSDEASAKSNTLLPYFITIANNDRKEAGPQIKQGNERVLKARLADGRFFFFDDQKQKLSDRKQALQQLTFQEGLGSYLDKVERLISAGAKLADTLKLDKSTTDTLIRALELCKLDLVTNLVRELPELQGYVGSWYAELQGEAPGVVQAITSHYAPRSTEDSIPQDKIGMLASVVDKADNLVGLFALGKKPSGSSDPYALRRQAQGLIAILLSGLTEPAVNLTALIDMLLDNLEPALKNSKRGFDKVKVKAELDEFLLQRLKGELMDRGAGREVLEAVLSVKDPLTNLPDILVRLKCVENLIGKQGGLDLVRAGVRVGNILNAQSHQTVDPALFSIDAEKKLWDAYNAGVKDKWQDGKSDFVPPSTGSDYERVLDLLAPLGPVINEFFDNVMVNDPDLAKKNNRHGLLWQVDRYFKSIADFTKLQSLLV